MEEEGGVGVGVFNVAHRQIRSLRACAGKLKKTNRRACFFFFAHKSIIMYNSY